MKNFCFITVLTVFLAASNNICSLGLSSSPGITQESDQLKVPTNGAAHNEVLQIRSSIMPDFLSEKGWVYEYLKNTTKQAYIKINNLREPSPELRLWAEEALRENGITQDVIILEGDNLDAAAYVKHFLLFTFLVIDPKYANDSWTIHHEIGHIYYGHNAKFLQKEVGMFILYLMLNFFEDKVSSLNSNFNRGLRTLLLAPALIKLLFIKHFYRQNEKEADLFACTELLKKNKLDDILYQLVAESVEDDWHPTNAESREYIRQCLLDHGISQETITNYVTSYINAQSKPLAEDLKKIKKVVELYRLYLPTPQLKIRKLLEKVSQGDEKDLSSEEANIVIDYIEKTTNMLTSILAPASGK